jgi:hypothetical protein
MKRLVLALAVVAAAIVLPAGLAAGAVKSVKSTVTITSGEADEFTGKVTSASKKCRDDRKVTLFMKPYGGGDDIAIGSDRTSSSGVWTLEGSFVAGIYYARVASVLVHINGAPIRCAVDLSMSARY